MPCVIRLDFPRKESKQTFISGKEEKEFGSLVSAVAMRRVDDIETPNIRKTLYYSE